MAGSAIEFSDKTISRKDFAEVMRRIKDAKKTFKESGFSLAYEGSLDDGTFRVISGSGAGSDEMLKLQTELSSLTTGMGYSAATMRAANIKRRHYAGVNARYFADIKKRGLGQALGFEYDAETKKLDMMYEVGKNTSTRVGITNAAARSEALENANMADAVRRAGERTPGSLYFRDKVHRGLDRRKQTYDDTLEWAKKNRKHPVAKRILNANKSKGRKMLEAAGRSVRGAVVGAVLGLIKTGVNQMVKYLASLPAIAEDTRKLSLKGVLYNIDKDTMLKYRAMANVMQRGDNGKMFQEAQAVIHSKLGDILQ